MVRSRQSGEKLEVLGFCDQPGADGSDGGSRRGSRKGQRRKRREGFVPIRAADGQVEQRRLAFDVAVQRALGDAESACNVIDLRSLVALRNERIRCDLNQPLKPVRRN